MGEWDLVIEALLELEPTYARAVKPLLECCIPTQQGNEVTVRVPVLVLEFLQKHKTVIGRAYHSAVKLQPDKTVTDTYLKNAQKKREEEKKQKEFAKKVVSDLEKKAADALPKAVTEFSQPPKIKETQFTHFTLEDHLSTPFEEMPLIRTETNRYVVDELEKLIKPFPLYKPTKPIMLWGDIGQGKTHILQHFAWRIYRKIQHAKKYLNAPETAILIESRKLFTDEQIASFGAGLMLKMTADTRIRYITAEQVTDEHKQVHPDAHEFKYMADEFSQEREKWYGSVQWLFLDDIHALARGKKKGTLEWVYKQVDDMMMRNGIVVSATDTNPHKLKLPDDDLNHDLQRLLSRLSSGGVFELALPNSQDLFAVYSARLEKLGVKPEPYSVEFGSRVSTFREAYGTADMVHRLVSQGQPYEIAFKNAIRAFDIHIPKEQSLFSKPREP